MMNGLIVALQSLSDVGQVVYPFYTFLQKLISIEFLPEFQKATANL
jgi:hypothetical protein